MFFAFYLSPSFANEDDIFSYDLADLAKIEVKVATKSEISIQYSPSTVSAFTQAQLSQQGIEQLADLAEITPGFSTYSIYGEKVFTTRGQRAGSFENNKHLVLLDGIALNHARSNKAPIEYELPLYAMGQVEMLSGPASSLYGVGAFFGIANLTSDLKDVSNLETKLSYQSETQGKHLALKGNLHSDFGHSFLAVSDYKKEASEQEVGPNFSPLQKYYDDQESSFAYFRHTFTEGPSIGFIRLERDSGLGEHWNGDFSTSNNNINWLTEISFIQWPISLSKQVNVELQWVNNDSTEQGLATTFIRDTMIENPEQAIEYNQYQVNVESEEGQVEIHWTPAEQHQLLFGLSHIEKQDVGGYFISGKTFHINALIQENHQTRDHSSVIKFDGIYGQYLTSFPQWWNIKLTAGLRYDSGEYQDQKFSQTSPRIALVKEVNSHLLLRASYGSALKSPDLKEYALNQESETVIEALAQNPNNALAQLATNLEAEVFDSIEIAARLNYDDWSSQLTLYRNHSENALIAQPITFINHDGNEQLVNSFANSTDSIDLWGYELSVKLALSGSSFIQANLNQAFDINQADEAMADTEKFTAMLSYNRQLFTGHAFITQHITRYQASKVSSVMKTNIGYLSTITPQMKVSFIIDNLFDHQDYLPQDQQVGNPLPQRLAKISLTYSF
jgi:outer membrane receptor protein involved in Fe transport